MKNYKYNCPCNDGYKIIFGETMIVVLNWKFII